jgi:hypothetical protein
MAELAKHLVSSLMTRSEHAVQCSRGHIERQQARLRSSWLQVATIPCDLYSLAGSAHTGL